MQVSDGMLLASLICENRRDWKLLDCGMLRSMDKASTLLLSFNTYSAERCGAPPCREDEKRIVSSLIEAGKWELYRLRKCAFFVRRGKARRSTYSISKCNNERHNGIYKFQHQRALGVQLLDEHMYMSPACWLRICALIDQDQDRDAGEHCEVCR